MNTGKNSNKKVGNDFEKELCDMLASEGFWAHNMAQNKDGQPADIIAVKQGKAFLIDCKDCQGTAFDLSRIEENQDLSMDLWYALGNGYGLFAVRFDKSIYIISKYAIKVIGTSKITKEIFEIFAETFEEWVRKVSPKQRGA